MQPKLPKRTPTPLRKLQVQIPQEIYDRVENLAREEDRTIKATTIRLLVHGLEKYSA